MAIQPLHRLKSSSRLDGTEARSRMLESSELESFEHWDKSEWRSAECRTRYGKFAAVDLSYKPAMLPPGRHHCGGQ